MAGPEVVPARGSSELVLAPEALDGLIQVLRRRGFTVVGPTVREGAIVYGEIAGGTDLPAGWTDVQDAGRYRLARRDDQARFGYAVGPHSWKSYLLPPRIRLWSARRDGDAGGFDVTEDGRAEDGGSSAPLALFGARSCELRAIAVQDRILADGPRADADYAARRAGIFIVAVDCHEPGGTCFCVSMGTGPAVADGYDLVLSELLEGEHRFWARAGTERGAEVLAELAERTEQAEQAEQADRSSPAGRPPAGRPPAGRPPAGRPPAPADVAAARDALERAAARMGRSVEATGLRDLLADNLEHPRWDEVADRCLTCGNCTMVCPTCFCVSVEDVTDLAGEEATRWRSWESCFSLEHSHVHSGDVRSSPRSRYRQWLTHKFGTWHDQFGESGCVGCGRCITWCPVGIDVTEELTAIRLTPATGPGAAAGPGGGGAES